MDAEFSAEQQELRASVRRFLDARAPLSFTRARFDEAIGSAPEVWAGLVALGATGLLVAEEHGGAGAGMTDAGVVLEELGRVAHPGPLRSAAVATPLILAALASEDQGARWLPGVVDGSVLGTLALHDDGRGSSWHRPATLATNGAVSGTKILVPDGAGATLLLVTAHDDEGLGVHAIDSSAEGVTITATPTADGSTKLATITLERAEAERIGTGDATDALAGIVDRLVIATTLDAVGAASAVLDLAVGYAKVRVQFDQPIGAFQAVQHLCTDMLRAVEVSRAAAYYGLWAADCAEPAELHRAATIAKAYASDALAQVGADAIQIFGGVGYTWEADPHLLYKRLLTFKHQLGGPSEHLEELASIVL
ncbi:MAG: acyl-CoA dehydrogenase family protein [Acidimicrobiales bacterium]